MEMSQAPKGGMISPLNNEFYEGGQFMPSIGLPKSIKRKALKVVHFQTSETSNIAEIIVNESTAGKYAVNYRMAGFNQIKPAFFGTKEECVAFATFVLEEKAAWYESNNLMNHPTKFVIN